MNLTFSLLVICLAADESGPAAAPVLQPAAGVLVLPSGDRRLEVSLRCPDVRLNQEAGYVWRRLAHPDCAAHRGGRRVGLHLQSRPARPGRYAGT